MSVRETILDGMVTAFESAIEGGSESGYNAGIREVRRNEENLLTKRATETPIVMFIDSGQESLIVQDTTHDRRAGIIFIKGFVKATFEKLALESLNNIIADILRFLDSDPFIATELLTLKYIGSEENAFDPAGAAASCVLRAKITYVCGRGTY